MHREPHLAPTFLERLVVISVIVLPLDGSDTCYPSSTRKGDKALFNDNRHPNSIR